MKKMMDSTTVIITTTDNRVLLQKRDENPDIEYSGYYSLVSGYLEEEETPLDGIIRELKEEFEHKKSQKVHFSSITYLGSEYRADYDRWEYIHHTYLMDDAADIRILEGESFVCNSFKKHKDRLQHFVTAGLSIKHLSVQIRISKKSPRNTVNNANRLRD